MDSRLLWISWIVDLYYPWINQTLNDIGNMAIRYDEGLTLETSAFESLYGG